MGMRRRLYHGGAYYSCHSIFKATFHYRRNGRRFYGVCAVPVCVCAAEEAFCAVCEAEKGAYAK